MKRANLAVIGCGALAQNQHISNVIASKNANLCCFCDVSEKTLEDLARRFPHIPTELDYKKVLADPSVDGVVIATKEEMHVALTIEALKAGKHVYVEKPLGETSEECELVMKTEKETGKKALVGMNRRLAPAYRDVKEILKRNGGMKTAYYRIADDWCERYKNYGGSRAGGKRLAVECCHIIDILRYLADSEVKSVYCYTSRIDEDNVIMQFENGSSAMMMATGYAPKQTPKEHFEVTTQFGFVTVDDFCELHTFGMPGEAECKFYEGRTHIEHDYMHAQWYKAEGLKADIAMRKYLVEEEERRAKLKLEREKNGEEEPKYSYHELYPYYMNYGVNKGWGDSIEHFADVILYDVAVEAPTAKDAYQATKIVEAILESRETGKVVEVK